MVAQGARNVFCRFDGLTTLAALTSLSISSVSTAGAQSLACLTALRELDIYPHNNLVSTNAMRFLTVLRQLTQLSIEEQESEEDIYLRNKVSAFCQVAWTAADLAQAQLNQHCIARLEGC